jgi:hypothetical protein
MIDINKFLQLNNPDIARQTRNMSYFDALKSEIPGTKSYQGYNPFYKGADKTGLGGYLNKELIVYRENLNQEVMLVEQLGLQEK